MFNNNDYFKFLIYFKPIDSAIYPLASSLCPTHFGPHCETAFVEIVIQSENYNKRSIMLNIYLRRYNYLYLTVTFIRGI